MNEYMVVSKDNLDTVVVKTGFPRHSLKSDLLDASYRNCSLVVFSVEDGWRKMFVSKAYDLKWVMDHLGQRWGI